MATWATHTSTEKPTITTTTARVQKVDRTVRNLSHSERTTSSVVGWWTGPSRANGEPAGGGGGRGHSGHGTTSVGCGGSGGGGGRVGRGRESAAAVLDAVTGHVHERGLERGPLLEELVEGEAVGCGDVAHLLAAQPVHGQHVVVGLDGPAGGPERGASSVCRGDFTCTWVRPFCSRKSVIERSAISRPRR